MWVGEGRVDGIQGLLRPGRVNGGSISGVQLILLLKSAGSA
jgi:hypothetical protein